MKPTKSLLIAIILFNCLAAFAQSEQAIEVNTFNKHRIGIILGSTSATGDFGSTSTDNLKAGFAEGGVHIGLSYAYSVNDNIALFASYESFGYKLDAQTYAVVLSDALMRQGVNPQRTEVEIDPYGVGMFRVGPKFQFRENNVLFYLKPSIGFAAMIVPEIRTRVDANGRTIRVTQREYTTDVEAAYGISGGVEFKASDLIGIALNVGYVTTDDFQVDAQIDNGVELTLNRYSQPYSAFNIGINLGFNF